MEVIDLAGGLHGRDRAKADQRANERERIGPAPEGECTAAHARRGKKDLGHRDCA